MSAFQMKDPGVWKKKAMAFATRSHRHLWGKNNEDPLSFLFLHGLKNEFAKQHYLGWNKFAQKRPLENWGLAPNSGENNSFLLKAGIVVPHIVKKELTAVFICSDTGSTTLLPGSLRTSMILGNNPNHILVIHDLMDGLFLFQQSGPNTCVVIQPSLDQPLDPQAITLIKKASRVRVLTGTKTDKRYFEKELSTISTCCFHLYQTREHLEKLCLNKG